VSVRGDSLRLLVDQPAPAAWNMAIDEALLQRGDAPTLRLYGWDPHAVSLGYFQPATDFDDLPADTPMVRRLTGGGAIYHGDEVTFSLTLDAAMLPADVGASYRLLHDAAVRALGSVGVRSERCADGPPQHPRPGGRWCFAAPGRDDIVTAGGKLLGSAQRRIQRPRPRVLHHGSLVLRRPDATPFVAAVADTITPTSAFVAALHQALANELAAALRLRPCPGELSEAERTLAAELQARRYDDPAFAYAR